MRHARHLLSSLILLCTACGSCGGGIDAPRADEPRPHVRCLAADPPDELSVSIGAITLRGEDRDLVLEGTPTPVRFAAFAGPAPNQADLDEALAPVRESDVGFVVVLGDFGDDADAVGRTFAALAALERPVLLVPGGRDDMTIFGQARESLSEEVAARLIDVSAFDRVRVGVHSLLPVAGAPGGRYGRNDDSCGFGPEDLEDRADRLDDPSDGELRHILSWAAPAGGLAVGVAGLDAGDAALAEFRDGTGAVGGLYAWPREATGRVEVSEAGHRSEVLRRIAGAPSERADGERPPPGATFFTLGPDELSSP